ncbi:hypothetical protein [Streptomyces massasporeus]|uniref:hypothetical protein n=1 Tax=Streptomyces massasporeus TaxID=67324 RepID=UPI00365DDE08
MAEAGVAEAATVVALPAADDRCGIPVRGRALGADRAAVGGAAVTLISLGGKQLVRSVARGDGSYGGDGAGGGVF